MDGHGLVGFGILVLPSPAIAKPSQLQGEARGILNLEGLSRAAPYIPGLSILGIGADNPSTRRRDKDYIVPPSLTAERLPAAAYLPPRVSMRLV